MIGYSSIIHGIRVYSGAIDLFLFFYYLIPSYLYEGTISISRVLWFGVFLLDSMVFDMTLILFIYGSDVSQFISFSFFT